MKIFFQLTLVSAMIASISAILISIGLMNGELRGMIFLPAAFLVFLAVTGFVTWQHLPSPFLTISVITAFLRYVGFPILATFDGGYSGRSWQPPAQTSYDLAVFLMCYELVVVSFLVLFLERRYQRNGTKVIETALKSLPFWYVVGVTCFAIAIILMFPQSLLLISFLTFGAEFDELSIAATASLAAMIFMTAKVILATKIIHAMSLARRWVKLTPYFVLVVGLLNVFIYFGTNRMAVVLTAVTTGWIFYQAFGARARKPVAILALGGVLAFATVTERREYVQSSDTRLTNITDMVQVYTGGVYNVAIGVETKQRFPEASNIAGLAFDFLRPTIGFNVLLQNINMNYSNIYFNFRMFTHVDRRSQILPMIAQGNIYFGILFAPILSLFFVWIGYRLQNSLQETQYIEVKYAIFIVVLRLGFFWGQNSMNMMNFLSLNLFIPLLLLLSFFVIKRLVQRETFSHRV